MNKVYFLTGSTGFLGSNLLIELLKTQPKEIFVLIRAKSQKDAFCRIENTLSNYYTRRDFVKFLDVIKVINGDVSEARMGLSEKKIRVLSKRIDVIFHVAAICNFDVSLKIARKVNVVGTVEVLRFASQCSKLGRLSHVNHISTVAVAGTFRGFFREDYLYKKQRFNNFYEQSKFEAEIEVDKFRRRGLSINVFRPSLITGDSIYGRTTNFKMFYEPLHFLSLELFKKIPANDKTKYNLVPIDYCANAIVAISNQGEKKCQNYHILGPNEITLKFLILQASKYFGFKKIKCIPLKDFNMSELSAVQKRIIRPYLVYFNYQVTFSQVNAKKILKELNIKCFNINKNLLTTLFKFCVESGFIKKK